MRHGAEVKGGQHYEHRRVIAARRLSALLREEGLRSAGGAAAEGHRKGQSGPGLFHAHRPQGPLRKADGQRLSVPARPGGEQAVPAGHSVLLQRRHGHRPGQGRRRRAAEAVLWNRLRRLVPHLSPLHGALHHRQLRHGLRLLPADDRPVQRRKRQHLRVFLWRCAGTGHDRSQQRAGRSPVPAPAHCGRLPRRGAVERRGTRPHAGAESSRRGHRLCLHGKGRSAHAPRAGQCAGIHALPLAGRLFRRGGYPLLLQHGRGAVRRMAGV